jgi:hypothetical protein
MEGVHVRDNIKSLHVISLCVASSCIPLPSLEGTSCARSKYGQSVCIKIETSLRTQKKLTGIALLHTESDRPCAFLGFLGKRLTSERFQIGCECAAN